MYSKISRNALPFLTGLMILNYASWNIVSGEKTGADFIEKLSVPTNYDNICLTPECVHVASGILKNMDPNVDPCKDFYRFTCGGFLNSTAKPVGAFRTDSIDIEKNVRDQMKLILDEEINPNEPNSFRLAKTAYKTCINKFEMKEEGMESLKKELDRLGGWPVLAGDSWNDDNFDWKKSIYESWPNNHFISLKIKPNPNDTKKNIITIDYPAIDIRNNDMLKGFANDKIVAYRHYMIDVALALGANETLATEELRQSLEFEIQLTNLVLRYIFHMQSPNYNPMSLAQLSQDYSSIDWNKTINEILSPIMSIGDDEMINFKISGYFTVLEELMNRTPKRIQANYLMWRIVKRSMVYVNDDFQKIAWLINDSITNKFEPTDCYGQIQHFLPDVFNAMYIKKYFNENTRDKIMEIINPIKEELKKILEKVEWFDDMTREHTLERLDAISFLIGYDDELLIADKLEKEIYANVEFPEKIYFEIYLKMFKLREQLLISNLRNPVQNTIISFSSSPNEENMEYPLNKTVYISADILKNLPFDNARPKYITYGALGYFVSQEMLHAYNFDSMRHYVTPLAKQKYHENMECFINQYDNYTIVENGTVYHMNGNNSKFENMADTEGLKIAYYGYKNWIETNGEEKKLPGIDMTPGQLFWMSYANLWCTKYSQEQLHLGNISPFILNKFRVIGSLSNRPEFTKDFMCPEDSEMNPKIKCSIW